MLDRTTSLPVGDSRKRDPTGTSGIRAAFRAAGKLRLRQLRAAVRVAVVDNDLLGLSQDSSMRYHAPATRLAAFGSYLETEATRLLCSDWFAPHVERAWQSGIHSAAREMQSLVLPSYGHDKLLELTRREISGIIAALVQQVTRAASRLLTRRGHKFRAWRTLLPPFDAVGELRIALLADTTTVAAHNEAKLEVYRVAGVNQVGVNPEWVSPRRVKDAFDPEEARDPHGRWTAGLGSGARVIVSKNPTKTESEISLIAQKTIVHDPTTGSKKPFEIWAHYHTGHPSRRLASFKTEAAARKSAWWVPVDYTLKKDAIYDPEMKVGVRTAGDDRVCIECQDYAEGAPYDLLDVEMALPLHPRCRCSWYPWSDRRFKHDEFEETKHPRGTHGHFVQSGELDFPSMVKVGEQKGSNPGGVYLAPEGGQEYYIKQGKSQRHVANELLAADLMKLAGVRTLAYRPVAGGKQVATKWQELSKSSTTQLDVSQRIEARKDFAVHAWLANWDAVGIDNSNLGADAYGRPTWLDLGGALEYRAQGAPKGAAFGNKADEWESMRSGYLNKTVVALFGGMSQAELAESSKKVAAVTPEQIREAVKARGLPTELANKLIVRRHDVVSRGAVVAAAAAHEPSQTPPPVLSSVITPPAPTR